MKLQPYPTWQRRSEKVVSHYFNQRERWWEIDGRDLAMWTQEWNIIRVAGGFRGDGAERIDAKSVAGRIIVAAHSRWMGAAEAAIDEARKRGTIFPTPDRFRTCYVGAEGVTVFVSDSAWPPALVTCFRVRDTRRASPDDRRQALHRAQKQTTWKQRAAVRRASFRATSDKGDT